MNETSTSTHVSKDPLEALFSEFEKAENAIKSYEYLIGSLPVSSVNELRYAGLHVVQALKLGINNAERREKLDSAIRHAQRAYSDASMKYQVMSLSIQVKTYRDSFKGYEHVAAFIVPHYLEHIGQLNTLKEISLETYKSGKDTPELVDEYRKHIQVKSAFIKDLLSAKEPLFTAISRDRKGIRLSWILCGLGIIGSFLLGHFTSACH